MVPWDDWRLFLAISRERTLSGAARRLGVDQSTVSRRLASMEAAAGTKLFVRTPEGYELTAESEAALPSVQEIEKQSLRAEQLLVGRDTRLEGRVRLATSDSFAAWFLLERLSELRELHPGIVLEVVTGNQPVNLARREADLSVRLVKPVQSNLLLQKLGRGAWAVYASRRYLARRGKPSLGGGLAGHEVVGFDEELAGTIGARWLAAHATAARTTFTTNSLVTQRSAVVGGHGISPLPCLVGDVEPELVRVGAKTIGHHDIWLVVHPDVRRSARVHAVMDAITIIVHREKPLLEGHLRRPTPR